MPRQARLKSTVGIYHIMFRGNNRQNIFGDDEDRLRLISLMENLPLQNDIASGQLLPSRNCDIYAFCLMSNHRNEFLNFGKAIEKFRASGHKATTDNNGRA